MAEAALKRQEAAPITNHEVRFADDDIIVSKTDARGIMTYVNDVFLEVSGYTEEEMIGKPHSAIRHPTMPRCIFKLLWDTIKSGHEIFAYVKNRCKNGDYYWVLAHVTPTLTEDGSTVGYHSSRRVPRREALAVIEPLYHELLQIEKQYGPGEGLEKSTEKLHKIIEAKGKSYDEFILSL